jgi:DASS family divalent anion:Na+ symporter
MAPAWSDLMKARLAFVVMAGILVWMLPRPDAVDPRAWRLLAIFIATLTGIIAKPLPMGAMAIVGIAAALVTRTLTITEALSGFSNVTLWLVVCAFFFADGFIKTGLGARIAYMLVSSFGRSTLGLSYSLVATDLVLSPATPSNTARAAGVVFPILQSISSIALGNDPVKGRQTMAFLVLAVYQGTVITSAMFVTSMVANPLAVQFAAAQHIVITWTSWATAAVVPGVVSLLVIPLVVYAVCRPGIVRTPEAPAMAKASLAKLGPMTRNEKLMGLISIVMIMLWILGTTLNLDPTATALLATAALLLTRVLTWDDLCREHRAWDTFIWFGTLVMMASFLGQFGFIQWFSGRVAPLFGGIGWIAGTLGLALTYFYTHYFFASMTAHVSAMYAPFLAVAISLGAPPALAALVLGFFSSLFASLTHYGTAPAPILFGSGHVPLGTWWKTGLVVSFVNIAIWLSVGAAWWKVLGLW